MDTCVNRIINGNNNNQCSCIFKIFLYNLVVLNDCNDDIIARRIKFYMFNFFVCGNKLNVYAIYSSMQKVIYASFETDTFFRIIGFISIVITFLYHFPHHVHIFHNIMLGNVQIGEFYFCIFTQYQGRNRFTDTLESIV